MPWCPHLNMGLKVVILVARQALRRTPVGTVTHVGIKVGLQGSDLLAALHTHWTSVRRDGCRSAAFVCPVFSGLRTPTLLPLLRVCVRCVCCRSHQVQNKMI